MMCSYLQRISVYLYFCNSHLSKASNCRMVMLNIIRTGPNIDIECKHFVLNTISIFVRKTEIVQGLSS